MSSILRGNDSFDTGDYKEHISVPTSYHIYNGTVEATNTIITNGFSSTLYTGNGSTQSINAGVDMITQWGDNASETFGGLVWIKCRNTATNHFLYDTIRGATKEINLNTTEAEATLAGGLTAINSTGFTVGADAGHNSMTNNMVSWNFQTTHRRTGTTNHGKAYTEHYNPFTGFTIIKYEGSGLAGHEIPHSLGIKLGFVAVKNLSAIANWEAHYDNTSRLVFNLTDASVSDNYKVSLNDSSTTIEGAAGITIDWNTSTNQHIMYGWANSYFDESNKLIGNYELVTYQGTGVAGNKVKTRGKPAWVMVKRTDSTGNWYIVDNQRGLTSGNSNFLIANATAIEASNSTFIVIFNQDGFTHNGTSIDLNAAGGQYIALVAYDTNANGGGSYYPLASDTANVQINNALIPLAQGIDSNGVKNIILSKNETITGLTYTQGKNYVYCDKNGSYGRMSIAPNYGKVNPANGGDFYNVITNKWFTSAGVEITNSRNYLNHIVHADNDGGVLYVEELPKVEYKDIVEANEFRGKNACTAWVNFDGTTTPPTIRDSYNVSTVIRTATGVFDIYFKEVMDNTAYSVCPSTEDGGTSRTVSAHYFQVTLSKVTVVSRVSLGSGYDTVENHPMSVTIFGGKN